MKKSLAFTLAEVLITLAIIGVVAAMTIPSVIVNTNQAEFKTGLRKAVSVLNSSLTMNVALEGESPYDNADLFGFLQQHMNIMKSTNSLSFNTANLAFYTADGFRFEIPTVSSRVTTNISDHGTGAELSFNENFETATAYASNGSTMWTYSSPGNCGSYGLALGSLSDTLTVSTEKPCLILVDVNGDRKPTPANVDVDQGDNYRFAMPEDALIRDIFSIIITEDRALPLGVVAQKAMYQAQKGRTSSAVGSE